MTQNGMKASGTRIADFPRPHTPAAEGALALATHYQSAAIAAHSMRSWLWAEAFAVVENLQDVDHEPAQGDPPTVVSEYSPRTGGPSGYHR